MSKVTIIKIRRPEGHVETVNVSDKFSNGLTDPMFKQIKEATRKAGRGECLSYTSEYVKPEKSHIDRINAEGELEEAILNNNAQAAVKARAKLEELGGHTEGFARDVNQDAVNRALNMAD